MKRKFCLVLECDTDDDINFIRSDIEQELSCATNSFDMISFYEVYPTNEVHFKSSEKFLQSC